jgi:aminoglycoside phosphotransferase (APT) family kinase protein
MTDTDRSAWLDRAKPVREALDLERLTPYLQQALGMPDAPVTVQQFPGGHSNLTYLVRIGERELVLRRPPFGAQIKTAHDMDREFTIFSRLAPVYPLAPRPLLLADESVLGARFYVMERLPGVILRSRLPPGLELDPGPRAPALSAAAAETLAGLHALDIEAAGLAALGHPDGYVRRQVEGWTQALRGRPHRRHPGDGSQCRRLARRQHPGLRPADPDPQRLQVRQPRARPGRPHPRARRARLGDGDDRRPADGPRHRALLLGRAGDAPELRAFAFGPTAVPGSYTRREFAEHYARLTGRSLAHLGFYSAFGLYKTAVVAQQIYLRYVRGHTTDPRFAMMIVGVRALAAQAAQTLEQA